MLMRPGSVGSAALLIAGTALGAGVLALPIQTGLAGLVPAVAGIILVWMTMLTVVLAQNYGCDAKLASKLVFATTIASSVTVLIMFWILA